MELKFEKKKKNYKDKKVLKDISVTMGTGVYGILGPNGAGKTTMIKIMADVLRPDTGRILYDGQDIHIFDCKVFIPYGSSLLSGSVP